MHNARLTEAFVLSAVPAAGEGDRNDSTPGVFFSGESEACAILAVSSPSTSELAVISEY